ncbi:class I glutamine amidotransferase-like protein [Multifurca ochricompacta]|uniref:Class I glutamine amidotransferase-like protein n=1 Tax=Multifurca ochricompacta TaxID=376703 RepID=A0AAD4M326_9AGAM|nr:class I glutamine amidotransferase-like protein [Multifurca ochricompacta]
MATNPPRLALLVCDTPVPAVVKDHGEYPMIFGTLFRASLPTGIVDFVMDSYDVRHAMAYPPSDTLDTYNGIVITGSAASAYEDVEWINRLVSWVADLQCKDHILKSSAFTGICFGHQIVARALGGECVSNNGNWEIAISEVTLTNLGQRVFGTQSINIQQMHQDHVPTVPPLCHLLGSTMITRNQGMVQFSDTNAPLPAPDTPIPQIRILTLQGHPEFTAGIVKEIIKAREESGVIDKELAEKAWIRADGRNDGVNVIGRVIWEVLLV